MLARSLDGQLVRIRVPRRVRREHRGIDTAGRHLPECVGLGVRRDLTVPGSRGVAGIPQVDLRVDDQHVKRWGAYWGAYCSKETGTMKTRSVLSGTKLGLDTCVTAPTKAPPAMAAKRSARSQTPRSGGA
jgi:hypothetical protein